MLCLRFLSPNWLAFPIRRITVLVVMMLPSIVFACFQGDQIYSVDVTPPNGYTNTNFSLSVTGDIEYTSRLLRITIDGVVIQEVTAPDNFSFQFQIGSFSQGNHTVQAILIEDLGSLELECDTYQTTFFVSASTPIATPTATMTPYPSYTPSPTCTACYGGGVNVRDLNVNPATFTDSTVIEYDGYAWKCPYPSSDMYAWVFVYRLPGLQNVQTYYPPYTSSYYCGREDRVFDGNIIWTPNYHLPADYQIVFKLHTSYNALSQARSVYVHHDPGSPIATATPTVTKTPTPTCTACYGCGVNIRDFDVSPTTFADYTVIEYDGYAWTCPYPNCDIYTWVYVYKMPNRVPVNTYYPTYSSYHDCGRENRYYDGNIIWQPNYHLPADYQIVFKMYASYNVQWEARSIYVHHDPGPITPTAAPTYTPSTHCYYCSSPGSYCELHFGANGYVYDADTMQPMAGVNVSINHGKSITDSGGHYSGAYITNGVCGQDYNITIQVSHPGYQPYSYSGTHDAGSFPISHNIYLQNANTASPTPTVTRTPTPGCTACPCWVSTVDLQSSSTTFDIQVTLPYFGYAYGGTGYCGVNSHLEFKELPTGNILFTTPASYSLNNQDPCCWYYTYQGSHLWKPAGTVAAGDYLVTFVIDMQYYPNAGKGDSVYLTYRPAGTPTPTYTPTDTPTIGITCTPCPYSSYITKLEATPAAFYYNTRVSYQAQATTGGNNPPNCWIKIFELPGHQVVHQAPCTYTTRTDPCCHYFTYDGDFYWQLDANVNVGDYQITMAMYWGSPSYGTAKSAYVTYLESPTPVCTPCAYSAEVYDLTASPETFDLQTTIHCGGYAQGVSIGPASRANIYDLNTGRLVHSKHIPRTVQREDCCDHYYYDHEFNWKPDSSVVEGDYQVTWFIDWQLTYPLPNTYDSRSIIVHYSPVTDSRIKIAGYMFTNLDHRHGGFLRIWALEEGFQPNDRLEITYRGMQTGVYLTQQGNAFEFSAFLDGPLFQQQIPYELSCNNDVKWPFLIVE